MSVSKKIYDIEMLRALSIILVLIQHLNGVLFQWRPILLTEPYSFAVGVDIFFAISGFLIARNLLSEYEQAGSNGEKTRMLVAFWIKRAWRLWPAAVLWLLIPIVLTITFNKTGTFGTLTANLEAFAAGVLHVANFRVDATFLVREYGVTSHYWSLSLEEQAYFILPLLIIFFRSWLWLLVVSLILIRFVVGDLASVFRFESIAIGVLVAVLMRYKWVSCFRPTFMKNHFISISLFVIFVVVLIFLGGARIIPQPQPVITLICGFLVFIAAWDEDFFRTNCWFDKFIEFIASRSYSIYLAHIPVYHATHELWFRLGLQSPSSADSIKYLITAFFMLVLLVELTYNLVELPCRNYGRHLALEKFKYNFTSA